MTNLLPTPKAPITIRTAVAEDAASLRELRLEALANHPTAFGADYAAAAADSPAVWVDRIAKYAAEDQGVIAVAAAGGQLIGLMGLYREHWPKTRHGGTLWGVYVKPEWRGLRVGEALVEECAAWARARGMTIIKLGVSTTNEPAIRCYTRCGFTIYGTDPKTLCLDGVYYDEFLMAKPLS
jgi:ribosomal protein S18 acetylase RimI-like enzyme